VEETLDHIYNFANEGLRTLFLAQRVILPLDYEEWNKKYQAALQSLQNREENISYVAELIEKNFTLIGSTAIEDKLQDEVEDTISFIKSAGVKLWVLTGDKIETAINIGFSCNLLDIEMEIFVLDEATTNRLWHQLIDSVSKQKQIGFSRECAVVVGGDALSKITKKGNEKMLDEFIELT